LRTLCDYTDNEEIFCDVAWGLVVLGGNREEAKEFLTENCIQPSPILRVALYREGEEEVLREIERELAVGTKALKEKMLMDSRSA